MRKNTDKLLKAVLISAMLAFAGNLKVDANSLSFSDFSEATQAVLKDQPTSYGSGPEQKYFEFQYDTNSNIVMVEVSSPSIGAYTITYNYDPSSNTHLNNNNISINEITGNFINIFSPTSSGGAVINSNNSEIQRITGNFINNSVTQNAYAETSGGAILNSNSQIEEIIGDFIGNNVSNDNTGAGAFGGAITNTTSGTHETVRIGSINGNFINNYTKTQSGLSRGGALVNHCSSSASEVIIDNLIGDFIGNSAISTSEEARGGAISNTASDGNATIGLINGDFINNYVQSSNEDSYGGAILNLIIGTPASTKITRINGNFTGNYALSNTKAYGGAIVNNALAAGARLPEIDYISGKFTNNYAYSNQEALAGAIYNEGLIKEIANSSFNNNYVKSVNGSARGGALINFSAASLQATIEKLTGDFTNNYAISENDIARGGAISNTASAGNATIGLINGDFTGNYVQANNAYGGAIVNISFASTATSAINNITGDFTGNYAQAKNNAYGGAIYNAGHIGEIINSSFKNNYASTISGEAQGGAIYTTQNLTITADNDESVFSGNYTNSAGTIEQNAIYVGNSSAGLTLNVENNGQIIFEDTINGAAGYSVKVTGDSKSTITFNNLIQNAAVSLDTANLKIGVTDTSTNTSDVFKSSTLTANSGNINTTDGRYTNYNIEKLSSSEDVKYSIDLSLSPEEQKADTFTVGAGSSGTIYLSSFNIENTSGDNEKYILQIIKAEDDSVQLDYDDSKVLQWAEAVMSSDMILAKDFGLYTTDTTNDSLVIRGLMDSLAEWAELDTTEDKFFNYINNSDYTLSRDVTVLKGNNITIKGAGNSLNVNNKTFLDLIADNQNVSISDLTIKNSNDIVNNGILSIESVNVEDANIENNNTFNISGESKLTGDLTNKSNVNISDGEITFDNKITGDGNITISDSTVDLNNAVSKQKFTVNNSDINLADANSFTNNSLYMNSGNFNVVNLGMSNLNFDTISFAGGDININSVDVDLANETMGRITAEAYENILGSINVNRLNLISSTDKNSTEILFVDKELADSVNYNGEKQIAYSPIYKYDVTYNAKDNGGFFNFNRAASGGTESFNPAVLAAPVAAQVGGYLTQAETLQQGFYHMDRFTKYSYNQRLAAEKYNLYASKNGVSYSHTPLPETDTGIWFNPYTSFESVNLNGGLDVSNITYGTLVGGDTDLYDLGHGYKGVISTFIGYNGSHQSYSGNSIYQNGGTLGVTGTLYKNNFFTGITASTGASTGSADTMYGTDNFTMLTAGIASKTGYNFELAQGKFIIQPSLYLGYVFVNTFDYTNAAGVKIDSDPLHALQIMPGVTFICNLKNGWQPYVAVNMVWNAMDKTHFRANGAALPQLSVKPYVQYGVGVQKAYGENFTGFLQAMIRNGGRNGIALSAGFRWAIGRKNKHITKAKNNTPIPQKTEIILGSIYK